MPASNFDFSPFKAPWPAGPRGIAASGFDSPRVISESCRAYLEPADGLMTHTEQAGDF